MQRRRDAVIYDDSVVFSMSWTTHPSAPRWAPGLTKSNLVSGGYKASKCYSRV